MEKDLSEKTMKEVFEKLEDLRHSERIAEMNMKSWKLMYERYNGKERRDAYKKHSIEIENAISNYEKYHQEREELEDYILNNLRGFSERS